jgi:hypothetical protein
VGKEYYAGAISNLLIILMVSQFVFVRNDANIIDLTLDLKTKVWIGLLSAGCSAGLSAILVGVYKLGIVGLTLGFISGQLILSIGYPLIVGRFFGVSIYSQLSGLLRPALVTILLFGSLTLFGDRVVVSSWFSLILAAGLTVGLLSLLAFYLGVTREQRKSLLARVRKLLPN